MRRLALIAACAGLLTVVAGCGETPQAPTGINAPGVQPGLKAKQQAEQMQEQSTSPCGMDPYAKGCPQAPPSE